VKLSQQFLPGFILFWLSILMASGQSFHIRCLSIGTAGDVTVTWDLSSLSSADFRCYYLLHSTTQAGPFSSVESVFFFNDTVETHLTANAANNPA